MASNIGWSFFHKFSCRSSRPLFYWSLRAVTSIVMMGIVCLSIICCFLLELQTNRVWLCTGSLIFFRTYLAVVICVPSLYHEYVGGGSAIASQKIVLFSCIGMPILLAGGAVFHFGITEEVKQASKSTGKTDM